jgi:arabinoxylan arabinofuranohydrolase
VKGVDFSAGAKTFRASVSAAKSGGKIEVHLDRAQGPLVATLRLDAVSGDQTWKTLTTAVTNASGVHDLFFVFVTGDAGVKFDWWQFE